MRHGALFAIVFLLAAAPITGCAARQEPQISMTFDVTGLPQEPSPVPPAPPEPIEVPPEAAAAPAAPPDPATLLAQEIRRLNERLQPIRFDTGRWEITPDGAAAIEASARVLRDAGAFTATIEGHADERGSDRYNYVLGIYRAKAVKDRLRDLGLDPSRFTILSHGRSRPAAAGSDEDALSRNRRAEIIVRSLS